MAIIMTEDGNVRPLRLTDFAGLAERDKRIRELEALNSTLAQIDRMTPVVKAATDMKEHGCGQCEAQLDRAVTIYEQQMAALAKGEGG